MPELFNSIQQNDLKFFSIYSEKRHVMKLRSYKSIELVTYDLLYALLILNLTGVFYMNEDINEDISYTCEDIIIIVYKMRANRFMPFHLVEGE